MTAGPGRPLHGREPGRRVTIVVGRFEPDLDPDPGGEEEGEGGAEGGMSGGGGAKVVHGLITRLVKQGYDIDLVTMGFRGLPRREVHDGHDLAAGVPHEDK